MNMLPVFQWFEESGLGRTVRESVWAFAVIESIHLLALVTLGGAVLIVDLRALNLGLRERSLREVAEEARRFMNLGLVVLILSGMALFASEAVKCYYSVPFWVKMWALLFATIFTYAVRNRVVLAGEGGVSDTTLRLASVLSMLAWFVVAASGRWIGFSG